ncbi:MAG TPA: transglycosylase SLT domain-containing protein [Candidatus Polarisedimenticolaceae bacterium]|nr:transglycosylase SLT domain-containing protein [Candidatus Polarisedimenticolaceae bacterium]
MSRRSLFSLALAAVFFTASAGTARAQEADPFPCPPELREGVDFWKNVWSQWTLSQVVLHDTEHPSIVYEVFELPPPAGDVYTDEQRAFVKSRKEAMSARLATIEKKLAAGDALDDDEKALALKITEIAGNNGIAGASDRVRSQRGLRERFRRGIEISGRYREAFVKSFRELGLPEGLADLPHVESSFQVEARSSAGAVGVWQFTRAAAKKFMLVTSGIDERLDPVAASRGAARYLGAAYAELGSWPLAITSYNHGVEGMKAARDRFGTDFVRILAEYDGRAFGFASKNFYKEFLAAREIAADPAKYFPEGITPEPALEGDVVTLKDSAPASSLTARYGVPGAKLQAMNPAWTTKARSGHAPLPAGTQVWLPAGTLEALNTKPKHPQKTVVLPPSPPASAGAEFAVHIVKKGETLFRIATNYGVSLARLVDANGLGTHSPIHPGQELRIPVLK